MIFVSSSNFSYFLRLNFLPLSLPPPRIKSILPLLQSSLGRNRIASSHRGLFLSGGDSPPSKGSHGREISTCLLGLLVLGHTLPPKISLTDIAHVVTLFPPPLAASVLMSSVPKSVSPPASSPLGSSLPMSVYLRNALLWPPFLSAKKRISTMQRSFPFHRLASDTPFPSSRAVQPSSSGESLATPTSFKPPREI